MYKTLRKVLLLFLISIAVVCGTLFAVACGKNSGDDDDNDAKVTYSVTVTLAADVTDVTLTSLKAQWYSGNDAVSDAIALSATGSASVDLDAGSYVVDLVGVPSTATYTKASVTAASPNATINVTKKSITPVVPQLDKPTGLAINDGVLTWDANSNASSYDVYVGNTALSGSFVANVSVASYTLPYDLEPGNYYYSVVAKGDNVNYKDSDRSAALTYNVPEFLGDPLDTPADLAISNGVLSWTVVEHALSYNVYLSTEMYDDGKIVANVKDASYTIPTDLAAGSYYYSVVAKGDGVNWGYSEKSDSVKLVIRPSIDSSAVLPEGGTEHWVQAGIGGGWSHENGNPYVITAVGSYYIPVKFTGEGFGATIYADVIKFTAPEDGEHTYTFSWVPVSGVYGIGYMNTQYLSYETEDSQVIVVEDKCLNDNSDNGSIVFSLSKGEEVIIVLQYQDYSWSLKEGDEVAYSFTIEAGDPIAKGSLYDPFEIDSIEGTHSVPGDYDKSDAYFALPYSWESATYEVTFGSGLTVYVLKYGKNSDPVEILNGGILVVEAYVSGPYIYVSSSSGKIEFTLTKAILPGSADNPIALEKDEVYSYQFFSWDDAWFTFVPSVSGVYRINAGTNVNVYGSLTYLDIFDSWVGGDKVGSTLSQNTRKDVYLEGGKTYYLQLTADVDNTIDIVVIDTPTNEGEGSILSPKEITGDSIQLDFTDSRFIYLKYTASSDVALSLSSDAEYGVDFYLYSDAYYSVSLGDGYDIGDWPDNVHYFDVKAGVVYIAVDASWADVNVVNISITYLPSLEAPVVSIEGDTISWTSVDGATGYYIYAIVDDDGDPYTVRLDGNYGLPSLGAEVTSFDLSRRASESNYLSGNYKVYVVAVGDYESYGNGNSNYVTYTFVGK